MVAERITSMSTVDLPSLAFKKQTPKAQSRCSPWLTPLAYFLGEKFVIPGYFGKVTIKGQENLPKGGPLILAPTHRARWDSLVIPYAAGRSVTGRDLHFMVTSDEVKGLQGWFIRRLGGFAVNVRSPSISSLRHGIDLLQQEQTLVIYPEGDIFQDNQVHRLKPGLARIALQAESQIHELGVKILPVSLRYEDPRPHWRNNVEIAFGKPLDVASYLPCCDARLLAAEDLKTVARQLTNDLSAEMAALSNVQNQTDW